MEAAVDLSVPEKQRTWSPSLGLRLLPSPWSVPPLCRREYKSAVAVWFQED